MTTGDAKAYKQAGAVVDEPSAADDARGARARRRRRLPRRIQLVLLRLPARAPRQV